MPSTPYTLRVIRWWGCVIRRCGNPPDPHHLRSKGSQGRQVDECNVVPLCRDHHTELHAVGRRTFAARHRVCLPAHAISIGAEMLRNPPPPPPELDF